jgi:hypothetical protein
MGGNIENISMVMILYAAGPDKLQQYKNKYHTKFPMLLCITFGATIA